LHILFVGGKPTHITGRRKGCAWGEEGREGSETGRVIDHEENKKWGENNICRKYAYIDGK
jgi:hypothetical protein